MDKSERLTRFLEWAEARRASSLAPSDLRDMAAALLEASGGGRVTESHILTVGDRLAASGKDAALAAATECGELFLRFEEAERQAGTPAAAPRRQPVAEPAAPSDVAPPLRPPERVPTAGDAVLPPSPVTFSRPTQNLPLPSPRDSQPLRSPVSTGPVPTGVRPFAATEPAPAIPRSPGTTGSLPTIPRRATGQVPTVGRGSEPPAAHDVRGSQRVTGQQPVAGLRESQRLVVGAAGAFRCPRCAVMVTPEADGNCPRCGGPPPHLTALPSSTLPPAVRAGGSRVWIVPVALLLAGIIGTAMGVTWGRTACDGNRGASVAGETRIDRLGVKAFFPAGWRRHRTAEESAPIPGGGTGKMLGYYRGGRADDPEVGLMLMVTDNLQVPAGSPEITDADFRRLLDEAASGMSKNGVTLEPCVVTEIRLRRTGRCTGEGRDRGTVRRVALYAFTMDRKLGIAMFFARSPIERLLPESDGLVGSIESI